jgi:hypothetical protein
MSFKMGKRFAKDDDQRNVQTTSYSTKNDTISGRFDVHTGPERSGDGV